MRYFFLLNNQNNLLKEHELVWIAFYKRFSSPAKICNSGPKLKIIKILLYLLIVTLSIKKLCVTRAIDAFVFFLVRDST